MSENESRPLERWSMGQIMWSGRTSEFVNAYATSDEVDVVLGLFEKAYPSAREELVRQWKIDNGHEVQA